MEAHAKALSEHRDEALKQLEASKEICQKNTAQAQEVLQQNLLSTREGLEKALGEHKEHTAQATELQKKEHSALSAQLEEHRKTQTEQSSATEQALAKQVAELAKLETKLETKVEATEKEVQSVFEGLKMDLESYKKVSAEQLEGQKAQSAAAVQKLEEKLRDQAETFQKGLSESANALVSTKQGLDKDLAAAKSEHAKALEAGLCKRESK